MLQSSVFAFNGTLELGTGVFCKQKH